MRQPDISVARKLLGWEPKVGLREGIRLTLPHFQAEVDRHDAQARTIE